MPVTIEDPDHRSVGKAIWNGMRLKCPKCGKGHLFKSFLKVADTCDVCGEELYHHRADDFPPYISILITGHLIVGIMLEMELHGSFDPWVYMATMVPAAVILPIAMLPSIKGAIVGLQWATRMHGFDPAHRRPDPALPNYP